MDISKQWKRIIDTLQDGILVLDTAGVIQASNPAAEKLTGYSMAELEGSSCRILNCTGCKIVGKGKGKEFCKLFSVGRSKLKRCIIKNKKDLSVHILKVASVLEDEQGEVIGAVEVLTDMTDLVAKQQEIETLKHMFHLDEGFNGLLGKTPVMEKLFHLIVSVAQSDAPVLIQGESGTGKELVALAIHENSPRRNQPFIKVNCAALNESLLESELFGHVKGAFTGAQRDRIGRFEAANTGTLFLDEIGDIPLSTQVKLLRVLEEKVVERVGDHHPFPVDIRIITATNRDLERLIEKDDFREDLFFRINVFPIQCPCLTARKEDIPLIIENFINRICAKNKKPALKISSEAMEIFLDYDWPGNVRELRNAIEYAAVLCTQGWIEPKHIPPKIRKNNQPFSEAPSLSSEVQSNRETLLSLLKQTRGNQSELARKLGISRVTLWKRIKKQGIRIPEDI
jgi:two-component system, NtrC family, response regulator HydG